MRNRIWIGLLTLALVLVLAGVSSAQKEATFEGTLVDSKCYLKDNSLTGNDHGPVKECGTMCLKGGTPGGLLTKDKKFHAILAPSLVLAPYVGYGKAAEVAKESQKTGRSIREIILARELLSPEALEEILDPFPLTNPGVAGKK